MRHLTAPDRNQRQALGQETLLWLGVLLAPAAWSLHLMVAYGLVQIACDAGGELLLHGATIGFAALAILGGVIAWRNWQRTSDGDKRGDLLDAEGGRQRFMALFGLINTALFLSILLLAGAAVFFIDPCTR